MDFLIRIIILFLSVLAAFVPMIGYLLLVWWMDRYLRQPLWMVALVFVWGAVGAISVGITGSQFLEYPLAQVFGRQATDAIGAIFIAPFVEEIAKGCVLMLVAMRRDFNSIADGVVFGAAAGLGFGMTENFLYFNQVYGSAGFSAWLQNIYVRTLFSALLHCVTTSTFGMALGFVKFRPEIPHKRWIVIGGLLLAMILHGFWNACMVLGSAFHSPLLVQTGLATLPVLVILLLIVYQIALYMEGRIFRAELMEESQMGTIPTSDVATLSSYLGRKGKNWCPPGVDREQYVALAMGLASKRHQWKSATGRRRARLESALSELRAKLSRLLNRKG